MLFIWKLTVKEVGGTYKYTWDKHLSLINYSKLNIF